VRFFILRSTAIVGLALASTFLWVGCREAAVKEAGDKMARAETALGEEDWEAADELYYEALLLDPDRVEAWVGRGMTQTQLGHTEEARGHYQQALLLYEKQSLENPMADRPLRGRILLLVLLGRSGEALALASEASRGHPDRAFARELEALVHRIENEFSEMILAGDTPAHTASTDETP
jgi:Flp pilus assembly protein TadD